LAHERNAAYGRDELIGLVWSLIENEHFDRADFVLAGSARLLAEGLLERISDIDIVARNHTLERAFALTRTDAHGGVIRGENTGDDIAQLFDGRINVTGRWLHGHGVTDELIADAEHLDGLPYLRWNDIEAYKRHLNRPKDRSDLALMRRHRGERRLAVDAVVPFGIGKREVSVLRS
jgi:hypothetical protein